MREDFKTTGIYIITDQTNGKFYIGAAINVKNRFNQHFNKNKSRKNKFLSKIPETKIRKQLLERIDVSNIPNSIEVRKFLIKREQYWLDLLKPFNDVGYNKCRKATNNIGICNNNYILTSPCGNNIVINNISEFCRKNKFNVSCVSDLIRGKLHTYKGWKCPTSMKKSCDSCNRQVCINKTRCISCHKKIKGLVNGQKSNNFETS